MPALLPLLSLSLLAGCTDQGADGELIDGILLPDVDSVDFVEGIDNPYLPLVPGSTWVLEAETDEGTERVEIEVLSETRVVNGVTATVVYDLDSLDGEITEETWDWFAQDSDGNVWYLGEETCEFEDGACVEHAGEWEWGVDGALPGIVMWADPQVDGQPYFQEYYEGEAEDVGEVLAVGETVEVPGGTFDDCVRTSDTSHIEADLYEEKLFCRGAGNVKVEEEDFDVVLLEFHAG